FSDITSRSTSASGWLAMKSSGLSQSTVSTHLAILQRAGLIHSRRVGQWVFYQRNEACIAEFLQTMQAEL
ncbi:ArsR/SmtB family transcription factor, partial [Bordetella bronchiseptica]|uniref:ArsR/SmtB family transcription factor n=1 Tax=Bordetella bronchiseptica TaxID=518 RepID=UPI00190F34DE